MEQIEYCENCGKETQHECWEETEYQDIRKFCDDKDWYESVEVKFGLAECTVCGKIMRGD